MTPEVREATGEPNRERVLALPPDAVRDMPAGFAVPLTVSDDPITENTLVVWREDLVVDGVPTQFDLATCATRERKSDLGRECAVRIAIETLTESVWQTKEFIRLGCYREHSIEVTL